MKAWVIYTAHVIVLYGGINLAIANNENEKVSIEERVEAIQYSLNQMFMEASEQLEVLTNEIRAVKQSLDHLAWYSEHVKQSVAAIQSGNEFLIKNVTLLTLQSDEITENQQYCANHEVLKNHFFELKPKCGELLPVSKPVSKPSDTVYSSCKHVPQRSGVYQLTVYRLNDSATQHVQAYCEMDEFGGGWTVFQKRQDGSVNFNRSWSDYKNGFGSPSGEYWLGLETLHELTTQRQHELLIILENFNGTTTYERYSGVVINGEMQKYHMFLKHRGTGSAHDKLYIYTGGEPFITYDVEDANQSECAKELASGFWRYNCGSAWSNLNGIYGNVARIEGIWWDQYSGHRPLKRVQMMIREITN